MKLPLPVTNCTEQEAEASIHEGPHLTSREAPTDIEWDWSCPSNVTVAYPGLGKATIANGREILLRPVGNNAEWRGLIFPCFAALMYQRGTLCLHGSAVSRDGKAIGFLGPCGAGKSTLVTQLASSGWRFLSDDLLFLETDSQSGSVTIHPGFSVVKLCPDSAQIARQQFSSFGPLYPDTDKNGFLPPENCSDLHPRPLHSLFILTEGTQIAVAPIPPREALLTLLENTYGVTIFEGKPPATHFKQCAELAAKVPLKRLTRPKDFRRSDDVHQAILESLEQNPADTPPYSKRNVNSSGTSLASNVTDSAP